MEDLDFNEVDWAEGQAITGCSDLQVRFVQELMKGANKTQAYREAGYSSAAGSTLRSAASQAAKSAKVRSLIAWAEAGGAGITDVPGDQEELLKLLWRTARGKDKGHATTAQKILHDIQEKERQRAFERGETRNPLDILDELSQLSPLLAYTIAEDDGLKWEPKSLTEEAVHQDYARLQERLGVLLELARRPKANGHDKPETIETNEGIHCEAHA